MSGPEPQQLAPWGAQVQPRSLGSCPVAESLVLPRRLAQGRPESSFSIEAILARPGAPDRTATPLPLCTCTSLNLTSASQHSVPPWVCSAAGWLPAYLSLGVYPLCTVPCAPAPNGAHLFCHQGLSLTGSELPHCPGLWSPVDWAATMTHQDTERHRKRPPRMFNLQQLEELERAFAEQHSLVGQRRAQLAARLHLTENQVKIWFQNRRVKYRKQQKRKSPSSSAMQEPSSSSDGNIQSEGQELAVKD